MSTPLVWLAGAAVVALAAILVFAVVRTSRDATPPSGVAPPPLSSVATSQTRSTSTTRSYTVPRVQTSEDTAPVITGPPAEAPPVDDSPSPTSTTIYNPYVTTTPPAADGV